MATTELTAKHSRAYAEITLLLFIEIPLLRVEKEGMMARRNLSDEGREMMETRLEAEAFVNAHKDLISASKEEIQAAIGKIGRALWELKIAQRKTNANSPKGEGVANHDRQTNR